MAMQEKGTAHQGIGIDGTEVINVLINMPEVAVTIGIGINNLMIDMNGKRIEVGELGRRVQIGADEVMAQPVQHLLPYSSSIILSWLIGHSQLLLKRMRSRQNKKGFPSTYSKCMSNTSFSNRTWHGLCNLLMLMKSVCVCVHQEDLGILDHGNGMTPHNANSQLLVGNSHIRHRHLLEGLFHLHLPSHGYLLHGKVETRLIKVVVHSYFMFVSMLIFSRSYVLTSMTFLICTKPCYNGKLAEVEHMLGLCVDTLHCIQCSLPFLRLEKD